MSVAIREWMVVNGITMEKLYEAWQERDHFRAAYARKLLEHSKTLSQAAQLCEERDEAARREAKLQAALEDQHERLSGEIQEARAKLAEYAALEAKHGANGEPHASLADCIDFWRTEAATMEEAAKTWLAKKQEAEAHCATLRAALEPYADRDNWLDDTDGRLPIVDVGSKVAADSLAATPSGSLQAVQREAIREWCAAIGDEAMAAWIDNTPEPLEPRDLLKRLLFAAGRDRAMHCATLRAALEVARGYLPHREDSSEVCYDWCPLCRADAALAATPAATLQAVQREAIREWCEAIQDDAITSWLDHTPEPLGPGDLLKRLLLTAGRDRAVQELQQKTEEFDARAFHVGGPAEKAFMECRDACSSRADKIAKEGQV